MNRDDALQLMTCQLYRLLGLMFSRFRRWMPQVDYPRCAVGLSTGGVVGYESAVEMEDEADAEAVRALEAAYDDLSPAERIFIEMCIGLQPWVWTVRESVANSAIRKLETKLRGIGAL